MRDSRQLKNNKPITVWVPSSLKQGLEAQALREHRSVSNYIRWALIKSLERDKERVQ